MNSAVSTSLITGSLSLVIYKILNFLSTMNFISGNPSSLTHTNTELMGGLMII